MRIDYVASINETMFPVSPFSKSLFLVMSFVFPVLPMMMQPHEHELNVDNSILMFFVFESIRIVAPSPDEADREQSLNLQPMTSNLSWMLLMKRAETPYWLGHVVNDVLTISKELGMELLSHVMQPSYEPRPPTCSEKQQFSMLIVIPVPVTFAK